MSPSWQTRGVVGVSTALIDYLQGRTHGFTMIIVGTELDFGMQSWRGCSN
jgi:hypothetical protein